MSLDQENDPCRPFHDGIPCGVEATLYFLGYEAFDLLKGLMPKAPAPAHRALMTSPSAQGSSQALRINLEKVAHETIDDEVIIINLDTGTYYNLVGVALDIWQGLEAGASVDQIADALCAVYGITTVISREAVDGFLASLLAEEILAPVDASAPSSAPFQLPDRSGETFTPPVLTTHTNMSDLLMLDPIHDVDEQGWPSAPPREAGQ